MANRQINGQVPNFSFIPTSHTSDLFLPQNLSEGELIFPIALTKITGVILYFSFPHVLYPIS